MLFNWARYFPRTVESAGCAASQARRRSGQATGCMRGRGASIGAGAASGAITGLVAITPACGAVTPVGAIILGVVAGVICPYAVALKTKLGYDDTLDVVGVHLVGGIVGTLMIGFLASDSMPNATNGVFYGGGFGQLWKQAIAAGAVIAYSFVVAFIIAYVLKMTMGIRVAPEDEEKGIDSTIHRDGSYEFEFA